MAKVLLAEDDYTMVALLKTLLGMEGYQVESLLDKRGDVLETIRRIQPDYFISDICIGDLNGIDLLKTIRSEPDLQHIQVIMASGLDKSEECLAAGADAFLMKPYMPEDLLRLLKPRADAAHG